MANDPHTDSTSTLYARILERRDSLTTHARTAHRGAGVHRPTMRENHAQLTLYAMQVQSIERWVAKYSRRLAPPSDL